MKKVGDGKEIRIIGFEVIESVAAWPSDQLTKLCVILESYW